ncbi:C6 transcription factor, putative [Talaromyces stipitatus ATCC 10500]|uniref:C6 transcription factor, putative n=1 Tax=Talaromyces stipitatus (strain ATCC 10500 / CBS 375.48 / QM 6759 / NRRL 1006) TaxID=441959 RepID=B8M080_TALSN|nr:C6 transcription factor, putative [Talaromyces stipitatus ATCC 10500]EED21177.1 C6 transcription factor, putative [Talaromyces stipitatus ATCC 10500]
MPSTSQASMSSGSGPIPRACDSCHKKKIHCDRRLPKCDWCLHHDLSCTFNRVHKNIRMKRYGILNISLQRRSNSHNKDSSVTSERLEVNVPGPIFTDTRLSLGKPYLPDGFMLSSPALRKLIASCAGRMDLDLDSLRRFGLPWQYSHPQNSETVNQVANGATKLPSRSTMEHYARIYCSSIHFLVFPVVTFDLFQRTLDLVYGSKSIKDYTGSASAKAAIYSFLSILTIVGFTKGNASEGPSCEFYAAKAQSYLVDIIQEVTMDGLQTLTTLILSTIFSGDYKKAAMFVTMASRIAYSLGGHKNPFESQHNEAQAHPRIHDTSRPECHIRNLFWLCYTFDKELALRTGQPPSISDDNCDLTLPPGYIELQNSNICCPDVVIDNTTVPLYPWDPRLSVIKSRTYKLLYSESAMRKSKSEIIQHIRELDHALEQWRMSLSREFRPTLTFSEDTLFPSALATQPVMLRLAYHHCMIIIHSASNRCRASLVKGLDLQEVGVASSLGLSVEASRSSLLYLQAALPNIAGECFWVILFYVVSSIVTILGHMISKPRDPKSASDFKLLMQVSDMVQSFPVTELSAAELIQMQLHVNLESLKNNSPDGSTAHPLAQHGHQRTDYYRLIKKKRFCCKCKIFNPQILLVRERHGEPAKIEYTIISNIYQKISNGLFNDLKKLIVERWFIDLKIVMDDLKITLKNLYNFDETGFIVGQGEKEAVVTAYPKTLQRISSLSSRESLTVVECINAEGKIIPPLIIP